MTQPTFQIEGLNKFLRGIEKLDDQAKKDFKQAGKRAGEIVVKAAQSEVPVVSGRLQKSIRAATTARGVKIRAGSARVPYAGPIHFGWQSRNIVANPFMYRAADKKLNEVVLSYYDEIISIWNRNI